jgi:hypothetical protein
MIYAVICNIQQISQPASKIGGQKKQVLKEPV